MGVDDPRTAELEAEAERLRQECSGLGAMILNYLYAPSDPVTEALLAELNRTRQEVERMREFFGPLIADYDRLHS